MHELQDKSPPDQSKIDELAAKVEWSTRIFEDRRKSIRYACEVPIIIEKRLFALSRSDSTSDGVMNFGAREFQSPAAGAGCASVTGRSMSVQPSVPSGYQATLA